jgi:hypothetical protein
MASDDSRSGRWRPKHLGQATTRPSSVPQLAIHEPGMLSIPVGWILGQPMKLHGLVSHHQVHASMANGQHASSSVGAQSEMRMLCMIIKRSANTSRLA